MFNFSEESLEKGSVSLKKMFDGEAKNVNPLSKLPDAEMRLYVLNGNYFETKEELESYCRDNEICDLNDFYILEYIRKVANRNDVIRKINSANSSTLYTAVDRFGYGIYNFDRSFYRGQHTWEFHHGCISKMYTEFRNRGIVFEDDIYGKIEENDKQLIKMIKERHVISI